MLEKTLRINALYDFYHSLLTSKQQIYMSHYYLGDYSLSEIASDYNVSRQAVHDNLKRAEQILERYEKKLKLFEKHEKRQQLLQQLIKLIEDEDHSSPIKEVVQALKQMN